MKIIKCQGGLGNQLFGLAFAHTVATLTGERTGLDTASFAQYRYGHRFALSDLAAALSLEVVSTPVRAHRLVGAAMRRSPLLQFGSDHAPPRSLKALRHLAERHQYFDGYWQSEAFFADRDLIRSRVRDHMRPAGAAPIAYDVVVHYRTYADEFRPERRGVPGVGYVRRALANLAAEGAPISGIALVSDDPARARLQLGELAFPMVVHPEGSPLADLALMLQARSLILTNSSFSWWGGYCSEADRIIYPLRSNMFHYPAPARRFRCL